MEKFSPILVVNNLENENKSKFKQSLENCNALLHGIKPENWTEDQFNEFVKKCQIILEVCKTMSIGVGAGVTLGFGGYELFPQGLPDPIGPDGTYLPALGVPIAIALAKALDNIFSNWPHRFDNKDN